MNTNENARSTEATRAGGSESDSYDGSLDGLLRRAAPAARRPVPEGLTAKIMGRIAAESTSARESVRFGDLEGIGHSSPLKLAGVPISESLAAIAACAAAGLIIFCASLATPSSGEADTALIAASDVAPGSATDALPDVLTGQGTYPVAATFAEMAGIERLNQLFDDSARALESKVETPLFGELDALALDAGRVADALLFSLVDPLADVTRPVWENAATDQAD